MSGVERFLPTVLPHDAQHDAAGFALLGFQLQMELETRYDFSDRGMVGRVWANQQTERRELWTNLAKMDVFLGEEIAQYREEIRIRHLLSTGSANWVPEDIFVVTQRAMRRVNPLATDDQPLMQHLLDAGRETKAFLLHDDQTSRFDQLLSDETAQAVALVVAPNHDLMKFLAGPQAQVMRDHEQLAAWLLKRHFGGITELSGLVAKSVPLLVNHENMLRPNWHRDYSVHAATEEGRARGIFFIMDVMTGVFQLDANGRVRINRENLRGRFGNLYFRHIDRSGPYANGYSPEWGIETIGVAIDMFQHLSEWGLVQMESDWEKSLWEVGLETVELAMERHYQHAPGARLDANQYERVVAARQWLEWKMEQFVDTQADMMALI